MRPEQGAISRDRLRIVPDVVAWHADCAWRVALNPATTPRLRVNAMQERALDQAEPSEGAGKLLDLLGIPEDARDFAQLDPAVRIAPGTALPAPSPVFPRFQEPAAVASR